MMQADRDRLVALKKAKDKKITQRQAAEELQITERQVRRLLAKLRKGGDWPHTANYSLSAIQTKLQILCLKSNVLMCSPPASNYINSARMLTQQSRA